MAEVKVFFKPEVEHFLNELIYILYKENYFSYLENAIDYKDKIIDLLKKILQIFHIRTRPYPFIHWVQNICSIIAIQEQLGMSFSKMKSINI